MEEFGTVVALLLGIALSVFVIMSILGDLGSHIIHDSCKNEHNTRKCVQIYVPWDSELANEYDYFKEANK